MRASSTFLRFSSSAALRLASSSAFFLASSSAFFLASSSAFFLASSSALIRAASSSLVSSIFDRFLMPAPRKSSSSSSSSISYMDETSDAFLFLSGKILNKSPFLSLPFGVFTSFTSTFFPGVHSASSAATEDISSSSKRTESSVSVCFSVSPTLLGERESSTLPLIFNEAPRPLPASSVFPDNPPSEGALPSPPPSPLPKPLPSPPPRPSPSPLPKPPPRPPRPSSAIPPRLRLIFGIFCLSFLSSVFASFASPSASLFVSGLLVSASLFSVSSGLSS